VVANGTVRTLADIGVKLQNDGTLMLDSTTFNKALSADPGSVDAIFSTATTGISAQMTTVSKIFTDPFAGQLVQRTKSIQQDIKNITASTVQLQAHVDAYKARLQQSFATMESLIANYTSIGSFLTASASAASGSSSK